jgi:hypothetical protein
VRLKHVATISNVVGAHKVKKPFFARLAGEKSIHSEHV